MSELEQLKQELSASRAANAVLISALEDLFKMMEENLLVRDVSNDHLPDWSLRALTLVKRLKSAHSALTADPDGAKLLAAIRMVRDKNESVRQFLIHLSGDTDNFGDHYANRLVRDTARIRCLDLDQVDEALKAALGE